MYIGVCKLPPTDRHASQLFLSISTSHIVFVCCVSVLLVCVCVTEWEKERKKKKERVCWVVWSGSTLPFRRCHAQGLGLTSAWGGHGTASATNPLEVPSFSRFSGFGFFTFSPFFSPLISPLCIPLTLLRAMCLIRVVVDAHSPATMKNKECQEKLPVVVLRAEEIMYSKANSEVFLVSQMLAECGFLDLSLCWVKPLLLNLLWFCCYRQSTWILIRSGTASMMPLTQSYGGTRHPRRETSCPHALKVLRFFVFCGSCTF